ncbi:uncharacterized protein LOC124919997 isoform X2 [Impatiens glandulifera]|nr:uncharacterized protein LOC124919997 isoform X2 [Impatiens glandulifera]
MMHGCEFLRLHWTSCASSIPLNSPPPSLKFTNCIIPSTTQQRSDEWFALRRDKLTTSTFSTALGLWKGERRYELWNEKVFPPQVVQSMDPSKKCAVEWGTLNESAAIERYKNITGRDVTSLGFAIHSSEQLDWLGASPDGLLGCFPEGGILEVKCPFNKGKTEAARPWKTIPFYYMPQVQGQMEIMDRDWVDVYCWTLNGSTIFRVCRERDYWILMQGVLREFWFENVVPAREALMVGKGEEELSLFRPSSTHRLTGAVISRSIRMAKEAEVLCREVAGQIEFYKS